MEYLLLIRLLKAYSFYIYKKFIRYIITVFVCIAPSWIILLFLNKKDLIIKQATMMIDAANPDREIWYFCNGALHIDINKNEKLTIKVIADKTIHLNFIYKYKLFSDSSDSENYTLNLDEFNKWYKFHLLVYDYFKDGKLIKKNIVNNMTVPPSYIYTTNDDIRHHINFNRITILE